jgi:hypothetical protein
VRWSIVSIIAAVAIAVIEGALEQMSPWAGLMSIASIGSLFALLPKRSRWQGIRLCPSFYPDATRSPENFAQRGAMVRFYCLDFSTKRRV